MSSRGRRLHPVGPNVVEYLSDDDGESYYEELDYPPPQRRNRSKLGVQIIQDRVASPARRAKPYHHHSYQGGEPENIIIENHLNVPQAPRPRASSTGAAPQANYIYVQPPSREPSRERTKRYHPKHVHVDDSDDDSFVVVPPPRRDHSRRRSSGRAYDDPKIAIQLAKLELLEEQEKKQKYDPVIAEKLARLKALEEKKTRDDDEAALLARIDERKRKDKQREEALLLQYQEQKRQEEEAEKQAIAKADAKRLKRDAEAKAERERLMLEAKDKQAKEKAERQRIVTEERERAKKEEEEAKEERRRILLEEEERKRKEKEKHEELRKRVLAEEDERIAKEKAKKKKEEDEFQQKVKERFMKAGYSPDYIEDILEEKKRSSALVTRKHSTRTNERNLAIDVSRPTYIRVKIEHLSTETLDTYDLPWDYDPMDDRYILIKEYVSHELQKELFDHTRRLKLRREKLLITDGYVKDTVTTLKPRDVHRDKSSDEMFVVRRKSVSKSPVRRSWMFT